MNKIITKMMMTGIACVALCGTTLAAPKHNNMPMPKGKAPMVQVAKPLPKPVAKPVQHKVVAKPMPKSVPHHVVQAPVHHHAVRPTHHMPPPPPPRCCRHTRHECHECHHSVGGATLLGAIVGGIIGAIAS